MTDHATCTSTVYANAAAFDGGQRAEHIIQDRLSSLAYSTPVVSGREKRPVHRV